MTAISPNPLMSSLKAALDGCSARVKASVAPCRRAIAASCASSAAAVGAGARR